MRRILTRSADDFSIKAGTDGSRGGGEGNINTLNARRSWDNGMHIDGNRERGTVLAYYCY